MRSSDILSLHKEFCMIEATSNTSGNLIAADKVNGTNVYNMAGDKLGTVDDVMIDKISGRAIYAVMSFGGFLGMGAKHNPIPWATLKYDAQKAAMLSTWIKSNFRTRRATIWIQ